MEATSTSRPLVPRLVVLTVAVVPSLDTLMLNDPLVTVST